MDFYKRVEIVCSHIPYGKVVTYGQVALLCQKPRNARQVGYGLNRTATNNLPAHRVVNHQGILSGASSFKDDREQKHLLEQEGVVVDAQMRVDLRRFGWQNTLDDALLLESIFKQKEI